MKKFQKLNRSELKNVMGGLLPGGTPCGTSECSSDKDCENSTYGPVCKKQTCLSTGEAVNICVKSGDGLD